MKGDEVKGHLDLLILSIVGGGTLHGYAVIERLRERSAGAFDLPEGTVYPALHRLERAGQLTSSWSESSGRRRKNYRLTDSGVAALAARRSQWDDFSAAVSRTLGEGWA